MAHSGVVATAIPNEEGQIEKLVIVNRDITDRKWAKRRWRITLCTMPHEPAKSYFLSRARATRTCAFQRHRVSSLLYCSLISMSSRSSRQLGTRAGDALLIQIAAD